MATVEWVKCQSRWCSFADVDLTAINTRGVYIIGSVRTQSVYTVYVGQGFVADRIADHRSNSGIVKHGGEGPLVVTWAEVSPNERDGVEASIVATLDPIVDSQHPNARPIRVNLPNGWV